MTWGLQFIMRNQWKMRLFDQYWLYLFKLNNRKIRAIFEICSESTMKTLEWCQWRRFGVFIVTFEHISYIVKYKSNEFPWRCAEFSVSNILMLSKLKNGNFYSWRFLVLLLWYWFWEYFTITYASFITLALM